MNHNQASSQDYTEVAKLLKTDLSDGLSSLEARERLKLYGPNLLESQSDSNTVPKYIWRNLLGYFSQFSSPLIQLLLICSLISASIGEYGNAVSVAISIIIVCTISYVQERRADRSLERLNKQIPNVCKVVREGQVHELESHCLVPGDIIYLNEGQRVPADVRLFDLQSLTLNEANLTGETQSQAKVAEAVYCKMASALSGESSCEEDKGFIHRNLAMMGTIVESGHSKGVVICTGKHTRYGEVFSMLKSTVQPRSPLQKNIDQLSMHLAIISCTAIALVSILGIVQQRPALDVIYYAISLAVTAIPEGLPVVVAVIMALGVLRLSHQKTIVKSLNSIETLGCMQVLCADKTGTLTRNDMTLTDVVTSELHSLSSAELEELNNEECKKQMTFNTFGGKMFSIGRLMEIGTLCNNASFDPDPPEGLGGHYIGQATECAILDAAIRMGFGDSRAKFERIKEIPFNPITRRMTVLCQRKDLPANSPLYYVKGAWEELLDDCTFYYENGLVKPRTDELWLEYARMCTTLCSQGLRVLALATGPSIDQLTFVGVVGITNATRDGIIETLDRLREFHIDVKMITGDSKPTAIAVGRHLGLIEGVTEKDEERQVMSGDQVLRLLASELDDLAMAHEIASKSVFYRVDPIQKANIVGQLQSLDRIVAMTGDGVNDVISLKRANLSLVMGSGADVCKEVADVVMVDDDLTVLASAIIEGRGIWLKIHSFMAYQMSISLALLALVALSFATKTQVPYTVIQLLFLNILVDGPPAQSLGVERVHERELNRVPRNVHDPILNFSLVASLFTLTTSLLAVNGILYFLVLQDGKLDAHARALLFTCFVFCSIFSALSLRSKMKTVFEMNILGNKELFFCNIIVILIQVAILNIGLLNDLFEVVPLTSLEMVYLFLLAAVVLVIMDSVKVIWRVCAYLRKLLLRKGAFAPTSQPAPDATKQDYTKEFP